MLPSLRKLSDYWCPGRQSSPGTKAFTLIELLITISILAILGSAISIVLNPAELLAEARDSQRINDLESVRNSLSLTLIDNPSLFDSLSNTSIYLSLPVPSCLTNPPSGYTYICNATSANLQKTDSTGWLPLSLSNLPVFPIDPLNSSSSSLYYAFVPDLTNRTFVITSLLESEKYLKLSALKDGGTDPGRIEEGNPTLWTSASGLVGYWPMDEGSGSTAQDLSGNGNVGTLTNGPTWTTESSCKVGKCLSFDGVDDYVGIPYGPSLYLIGDNETILIWAKHSGNYLFFQNSGWSRRLFSNTWTFYRDGHLGFSVNSGAHNDGAWRFSGYTSSGATVRTYLDGLLIASSTQATKLEPATGDYWLGRLCSGASCDLYLSGMIDEVRIYKRALSTKEIESIYSALK